MTAEFSHARAAYEAVAAARQSWDEYFLELAKLASTRSRDPSTRVGAVITGKDHRVRATGYNDFPSRVAELDVRRRDRELRLLYTEHAERNAIYGAAKSGICTDNCIMYITGLLPCAECARAIIQAGIAEVVVPDPLAEPPERWRQSIMTGIAMLKDACITMRAPSKYS